MADDSLQTEVAARIDPICQQFEAAWRRGEAAEIDAFLDHADPEDREALWAELVRLDLEFRQRRATNVQSDVPLSTVDHAHTVVDGGNRGTDAVEATPLIASESRTLEESHRVRFGDYELLEEISRGGMGVVYKARQARLNRTVAVKMILSGQFADADEVRRFHNEAEAAAGLDHPGIVPVFESGEIDSRHFFSMGFVEGQSLAALLAAAPMPPRRATELLAQVADAVHYAHERGIIHRDLKPGNILLDRDGHPRVADFGLAKRVEGGSGLTRTGQAMGTPSYMPPEQAAGKTSQIGPAADVYSLGAVLYAALTGRPPFQAANALDTMLQVLTREPLRPRQLNPDVPLDLETIAIKCLQKEPRRRYASAADLADELRRFLKGEAIRARRISTTERAWRWCRRNPAVAGSIVVSMMLIAVVLAVVTTAYFRTQKLLTDAQDARVAAQSESRRAQDAQHAEAEQRRKAETTLVDMYSSHGLVAAERNDFQEALLWFATAANAAESDPRREWANRLRFRNWLRRVPVPIYAIRKEIGLVVEMEVHPAKQHVLLHTTKGDVLWDFDSGTISPGLNNHMAWSRDGALLAIGTPDGDVEIVSFPRQAVLHRFYSGERRAPRVAFSHNRELLAVGAQNVRVFKLATKEFGMGAAAHPDRLLSLEFGNDDLCLVTSCADGKARVFGFKSNDGRSSRASAIDSQPRFGPVVHRSGALGIGCKYFPPLLADGNVMLVASRPAELTAVDLHTGNVADTFFNGAPIASAVLSADGRWLAMSADPRGSARIYDLARRRPPLAGSARVIARDDGLDVFQSSHGERTPGLAFCPGRDCLATIGHDSVLRFWNCYDGTPAGASWRHQGLCETIAFSPDGDLCVTAQPGQGPLTNSALLRVLRMPRRTEGPDASAVLTRNRRPLCHEPAIDQHGRWFATPGARWEAGGSELRVFETASGFSASGALELNAELVGSALTPDGRVVAAFSPAPGTPAIAQNPNLAAYGNRAGRITLWEWRTATRMGEPIATETLPMDGAFNRQGAKLVVACANGDVLLVDADKPKVLAKQRHPGGQIYGFALPKRMVRFSPSGDRFVTLGFGSTVRVWDANADLVAELPHDDLVHDASFSSSGKYLVTASQSGVARVWDASAGEPIGGSMIHPDWVWSAAFDPAEKLVSTGCRDKRARVWDWRQGRLICPALKHDAKVCSAYFSKQQGLLITAADEELRFWETDTGKEIAPHRKMTVTEPRLVIDERGRWGVAAGRQPPEKQSTCVETFSLTELDALGDSQVDRKWLTLMAEMVSARRVEGGGADYLTPDQWFERWEALSRDCPEMRQVAWDLFNWPSVVAAPSETADRPVASAAPAEQLLSLAYQASYFAKMHRLDDAADSIRQASSLIRKVDVPEVATTALRLADLCRTFALEQAPASQEPLRQGKGLAAGEWWSLAVDFYNRAIEHGAASHDVWLQRANCQRDLGSLRHDAELPPDWNDAVPQPSWRDADEGVAAQLTAAQGMLSKHFAFCQTLPVAEFEPVCGRLSAAGFRPVCCRPFFEGATVRAAGVWTRDARKWEMAIELTDDALASLDERHRANGLIAMDVAAYFKADPMAGFAPRFAALWAQPATPAAKTVILCSPSAKIPDSLVRGGFVLERFQELSRLGSSPLYVGVLGMPQAASVCQFAVAPAPLVMPAGEQRVQIDVRVEGERLTDPRSRRERLDQNLAEAIAAVQSHPDDLQKQFDRAVAFSSAGRLEEAIADFSQLIAKGVGLPIAYGSRARAFARLGKKAEAHSDLEEYKKRANDPTHAPCNEAVVAAYLGESAAAVKKLEQSLAAGAATPVCLYHSACALALASEVAPTQGEAYARRAVDLLRRWVQTRTGGLRLLQTDSDLDALRERDDFRALLQSEPAAGRLRQFTAVWAARTDRVSHTLSNLEPAEHLEKAKELAALGYRPVAVSVSPSLGTSSLTGASLWHRPTTIAASAARAAQTLRFKSEDVAGAGQPGASTPEPRSSTLPISLSGEAETKSTPALVTVQIFKQIDDQWQEQPDRKLETADVLEALRYAASFNIRGWRAETNASFDCSDSGRWTYNESGNIRGEFVETGTGRWTERKNGKIHALFKEVARTKDFIELYDETRSMSLRLLPVQVLVKTPGHDWGFLPFLTEPVSEPKDSVQPDSQSE